LPEEGEMLVGVLSGTRTEPSWLGEKGWLDFFDAKGVVKTLLERIGIEADFEVEKEEILHPGKAAKIVVRGNVVGTVGELHPQLAESFDLLPQPVALFELEIGKLLPYVSLGGKYRPLSRFPESVRDIAIVVDEGVMAKKVQDIIRAFPLVSQVSLFDLYQGEQIPPGKKSLAFRIVYQSPTHTLTDAEVDKVEGEILAKLSHEVGASLRG
jgi:phenylalanyl-tRNA synthetase beta chain